MSITLNIAKEMKEMDMATALEKVRANDGKPDGKPGRPSNVLLAARAIVAGLEIPAKFAAMLRKKGKGKGKGVPPFEI